MQALDSIRLLSNVNLSRAEWNTGALLPWYVYCTRMIPAELYAVPKSMLIYCFVSVLTHKRRIASTYENTVPQLTSHKDSSKRLTHKLGSFTSDHCDMVEGNGMLLLGYRGSKLGIWLYTLRNQAAPDVISITCGRILVFCCDVLRRCELLMPIYV